MISEQLGLNIQLVRLIIHEGVNTESKSRRQPFKFIKYKYITVRGIGAMIRIPEDLRNFYASKALEHKKLSYEERGKLCKNHKITYHSLKTIYEQMNVPKQHYKEDPQIYNLKKTCSTDFQVQQLLALELAEIKMRAERLIYLDYV